MAEEGRAEGGLRVKEKRCSWPISPSKFMKVFQSLLSVEGEELVLFIYQITSMWKAMPGVGKKPFPFQWWSKQTNQGITTCGGSEYVALSSSPPYFLSPKKLKHKRIFSGSYLLWWPCFIDFFRRCQFQIFYSNGRSQTPCSSKKLITILLIYSRSSNVSSLLFRVHRLPSQ